MAAQRVLAIVLAGGEGKRLMPLTADRAKPAVPFGGIYRLIDFALSNIVNSHYLHVVVLTQYKSHSLDLHIAKTWDMSRMLGNYVVPVPAQQRMGKNWYLGSADAIIVRHLLDRVTVPALVLQCVDDVLAPPEVGDHLLARLAGSTLVHLDASGRFVSSGLPCRGVSVRIVPRADDGPAV